MRHFVVFWGFLRGEMVLHATLCRFEGGDGTPCDILTFFRGFEGRDGTPCDTVVFWGVLKGEMALHATLCRFLGGFGGGDGTSCNTFGGFERGDGALLYTLSFFGGESRGRECGSVWTVVRVRAGAGGSAARVSAWGRDCG